MHSRTRVDIPLPPDGELINLQEAMAQPLSEAFGTTVDGVESESDLHQLLLSQGLFMLNHVAPDASEAYARIATRNMSKSHMHEAAFWQPADGSSATKARVLLPYTPQYGYLQSREEEMGVPLRMTFGLQRQTQDDRIHVARANIWVTTDHVSPFPDAHRVIKDINTYRLLDNPELAKTYFEQSQRSKARSKFVLKRVLDNL